MQSVTQIGGQVRKTHQGLEKIHVRQFVPVVRWGVVWWGEIMLSVTSGPPDHTPRQILSSARCPCSSPCWDPAPGCGAGSTCQASREGERPQSDSLSSLPGVQFTVKHQQHLRTVHYLAQQERNDLEKIVSELLQRDRLLRGNADNAGIIGSEEDDHNIYLSNVLLWTILIIGHMLFIATSIFLVENVWKNGKQHPRVVSCNKKLLIDNVRL